MISRGRPDVRHLAACPRCAACGKLRVCQELPCWLRYRSHARQRAWTCAACSNEPDEPTIAVPIAA